MNNSASENANDTMTELMAEARKSKGRLATEILDVFTKVWCINHWNGADLEFECKNCAFASGENCLVKIFKNDNCPDFEDFGSMTH